MRVVNGIYGFLLGFLCSLPLAFALSVAISCFWHPEGSLVGIERTATGLRISGPLAIHGVAMLLPLMMGVLGFMRSAHETCEASTAEPEPELDSDSASTSEAELDPAAAIARRLERRTWPVPPALQRSDTRHISTLRS